jgi:hypothetical protein
VAWHLVLSGWCDHGKCVACITKLVLIIKQMSRRKKKEIVWCVSYVVSLMAPYMDYGDSILTDMTKQSKHHKTYQHKCTTWRWVSRMCLWRIQGDIWIMMASWWRINNDLAMTDHTLEKGKHEAWRWRTFVIEKSKWMFEFDGSRKPRRVTYFYVSIFLWNKKMRWQMDESGVLAELKWKSIVIGSRWICSSEEMKNILSTLKKQNWSISTKENISSSSSWIVVIIYFLSIGCSTIKRDAPCDHWKRQSGQNPERVGESPLNP